MRLFASSIAGLIFALGLGISGMTDANKVIGFLNLAGAWDPSLAFVMIGAISLHLALFRVVIRRQSPLFDGRFHLPTRRDVTPELITGSALFGAGWGLGGVCPGPGLVSLASTTSSALLFVSFMLLGMALHRLIHRERAPQRRRERLPC